MDSSNGTMTTKETAATEAATMATAIPIECGDKSSSADNAIPEWDAIEINGQLVLPQLGLDGGNEKENDDNHQVELGAVDFVNGNPVMILGSHQLTGKVVTLSQPFVVLTKQQQQEGNGDSDTTDATSSPSTSTSYRVAGVVKRKLLFAQYPKIIMR